MGKFTQPLYQLLSEAVRLHIHYKRTLSGALLCLLATNVKHLLSPSVQYSLHIFISLCTLSDWIVDSHHLLPNSPWSRSRVKHQASSIKHQSSSIVMVFPVTD